MKITLFRRVRKAIIDKKYGLILISILFIIFFCIGMVHRDYIWLYDVADYWKRGRILAENRFNLLSIDGFRGYIYPLYLAFLQTVGDRVCFYAMNALIISFFVAYILPSIILDSYKVSKKHIPYVVISAICLCILYEGIFIYPLSDSIAIIFLGIAIFFHKKSTVERKVFHSLLAGIFCYWSYNVRTIYLFALISLIMIQIYEVLKNKSLIYYIIKRNVFFLMGVFIASIPQIIVNYLSDNILTLKVPTNGLMLNQIYWGITRQRYDTYIPNFIDQNHNIPQINFLDHRGERILEILELSSIDSWKDVVYVYISYPIEMALMYIRHFLNMIFPCWPEIYVKDLHSPKWHLGLLAVTIFFVTTYAVFTKELRNKNNLIYFIPMIVPVILIVPGAVEYRFALPVYFFAIAQLAFNVDWLKLRKKLKQNIKNVAILYFLVLLLCFTVWSSMLEAEEIIPLLM